MLREDLQNSLKEAMKNKDMKTVGAIRLIIAGQKEKDVEARGKGLEKASDADLLSMMQTMIKIYTESNRPDLAEKEQAEIEVINRFLPKQMDAAEIDEAIKAAIAETGAAGIRDMGKVMGALKAKYAGKMDFGAASAAIKKFLA